MHVKANNVQNKNASSVLPQICMPTAMKSNNKKVHHVNYFLPVLRHKSTTEKNKNISARAHKKSAEFPNWIASPHDRRIQSFRFNEHGSHRHFLFLTVKLYPSR